MADKRQNRFRQLGDRTKVVLNQDGEESRTKQSFKDECDINQIMAQWQRTGHLAHQTQHPPQYGDFSNAEDYMTACNSVKAAEAAFDALPAEIRDRMGNSPAFLLGFLADRSNDEEAMALGLRIAPVEPPPTPPAPPTEKEGESPQLPTPSPIRGGD